MLFTVTIRVGRKPKVLNPEAVQIQKTLNAMGFPTVQNLRVGKFFDFELEAADEAEARAQCEKMGADLLANSNIEKHEIVSIRPG